MLPKVGQLGSLPAHDKDRGRITHSVPASSGGTVAVAQTEFGKGGLQPLADDPSVAQLDLIDSGERVRTGRCAGRRSGTRARPEGSEKPRAPTSRPNEKG